MQSLALSTALLKGFVLPPGAQQSISNCPRSQTAPRGTACWPQNQSFTQCSRADLQNANSVQPQMLMLQW